MRIFFLPFLLFLLVFIQGCFYSSDRYFSIFYIDKNGVFVPLSFKSYNVYNDCKEIIYNLAGINVQKVVYDKEKIFVTIDELPKVKYEFDTFILYYSLFLSFFNSFYVEEVKFFYGDKELVLNGLDFSMDRKNYYKYPINDFFKISDAKKGKYYLYYYKPEGSVFSGYYVVPFLVPMSYDLNFYFYNGAKDLYSVSNLQVFTFDRALEERMGLKLLSWDNRKINLQPDSIWNFLSLFFDRSKLNFIFYNSDVDEVIVKYIFFQLSLGFSLRRGEVKNLSFNRFPLNK